MDAEPERMDLRTDASTDLTQAQRIGRRTGTVAALLTAILPMILARGNSALLVSLLGATAVVTLFARRIGGPAGEQIARRPLLAAPIIGALGGIATLLVAGVTAALIGFIWSCFDRGSSDWLYSYVGKPFLAVVPGGLLFAIPIGIVTGLAMHALIRRRPPKHT